MLKTDVVILGGGVIGLSIALKMLNAGREVTLLDPEEPGTGTSYGNAGTIAEYAVLPIGSPEIIKKIPSLLFNKNSPISIKRSEILSLAPWLIRFLYQSMPKQAAKNAQAITPGNYRSFGKFTTSLGRACRSDKWQIFIK